MHRGHAQVNGHRSPPAVNRTQQSTYSKSLDFKGNCALRMFAWTSRTLRPHRQGRDRDRRGRRHRRRSTPRRCSGRRLSGDRRHQSRSRPAGRRRAEAEEVTAIGVQLDVSSAESAATMAAAAVDAARRDRHPHQQRGNHDRTAPVRADQHADTTTGTESSTSTCAARCCAPRR